MEDLYSHEHELWLSGSGSVAGIDEAGRGPLAGPVVAAAVSATSTLPRSPLASKLIGLTDSKKLTESRRRHYFEILMRDPEVDVGIGIIGEARIDRINILQATYAAMKKATVSLPDLPDHILVDGRAVTGLPRPHTALVRGDSKSILIAAASVIAKVTRDKMMEEYATKFPGYGFERHKGYGTAAHLSALDSLGPCPIHRKSFAPVRARVGRSTGGRND